MEQLTAPGYTTLYLDELKEIHNNKFSYRITNIVSLGILKLENPDEKIDFEKIESIIEIRYLNRFPCVLFKVDNVSIIVFKNGKMIITGLKKEEQIQVVKKKIEKILFQAEIKYSDFTIEIQNFVAMTNLEQKINLEMACIALMNCIYEPEQFPAAIVRDYENGGAFLIFSNSKIICLGIRSIEKLELSLKNLITQIFDFELVY